MRETDDRPLFREVAWLSEHDRPKQWERIPILSPKCGIPVTAWILSEALEETFTHYYDRRSHPHTTPEETCYGCKYKVPLRYKAYLAGWVEQTGRRVILEVTLNAVEKCPMLMTTGVSLRGLRLTLRRPGTSATGAVYAEVHDARFRGELPAVFDVRQAMATIWYGGRRPRKPDAQVNGRKLNP